MTGTAVTKKSSLKATLEERAPAYQRLLPKWYPADRLITGALVAAQANPDLVKCNPQSVAVALARVAQWGLDVGDTAHLVPYGDKCTPIADYKGLIRLMVEAGARKVEARFASLSADSSNAPRLPWRSSWSSSANSVMASASRAGNWLMKARS